MMFADALASIAIGLSRAGLGAYYDAECRWPGVPVLDEGGSIDRPGVPIVYPCQVQVDVATEAMRAEQGYRDKDARLLVLCKTLAVALDTDATIVVLAGPHEGSWSLQTASLDACGAYWECRGRRA